MIIYKYLHLSSNSIHVIYCLSYVQGSSLNPYRSVSINKISPNGAADNSGQLKIGDHIISINGTSTEGLDYKKV